MLLMIDNYDSFTYNLVQYFRELGEEVMVLRNDAVDVDGIRALNPKRLVISPGPCSPKEAGISVAAIQAFVGQIPLLGVCLGHQSIAYGFGGRIVRAAELMHGKTSPVEHDGSGLFAGLPNPLQATRYHSLVAEEATFPDCLRVTARTADGTIMALEHRQQPVWGVQFHPESIISEAGKELLQNYLRMADTFWEESK
ncbi:MAG: aminodeoxychorismate/anthranilate synthase component II [Desulfuromonadaceae bacterium]|nr:aminodeoxychorismate/anthranilate synthase component II [Desulfuromonadaceae bacterium]